MQGKTKYWSIDSNVDSLFITTSVDDLTLAHGGEGILEHTYAKMGAELAAKLYENKVSDYTVFIPEPRPSSMSLVTEHTMIAVPGEVQRLHDRIQELEAALAIERRRNASAFWDARVDYKP